MDLKLGIKECPNHPDKTTDYLSQHVLLEFRYWLLQAQERVKTAYFKVSARKKLCCTSSYVGDEE